MNQELNTQLSELAKKLGTSVDKLYEATIKQAKIELIYTIIELIIFAICVWIAWVLYLWLPSFDNDNVETSLMEFAKIFSMIGSVGISFVFALTLSGTIKHIITLYSNPEYWAMQDILASVHLVED